MTDRSDPKTEKVLPRTAGGPLSALALSPAKAVAAIVIGAVAGMLTLTRADDAAPWVGVVLAMALAWCAMIDIDRYRLPDLLTLPMIACGLLYCWVLDAPQLSHHLIGAAAGYLSLVAVSEAYRFLRKRDGLGRGDAKLLAAAGAWLGWKALPFVVLAGSVGALIIVVFLALARGRTALARPLPFGPFLAAAFIALWIWQPLPLA